MKNSCREKDSAYNIQVLGFSTDTMILCCTYCADSITIDDAVTGVTAGQIDFPRAAKGGFGGGFFAIWVPDSDMNAHSNDKQMAHATYDIPLPDPIGWDDAI